MTDFLKFLYHCLTPAKKRWYPFPAVYYLTYRCEFRCPYCSDGAGVPYHQLTFTEPDGARALTILKSIRNYCNSVVITGGEPLQHPDLEQVLNRLPALKFKAGANGARHPIAGTNAIPPAH